MNMNSEYLAKFSEKIYFYCDPREGVPEGDKFQHFLICFAEGLKELGIPFFSNVNYWQESSENDEYLFKHDPKITPDDCSVVVLQNNWYSIDIPLPDNLFHSDRKYITVYFDGEDSDKTYVEKPEFRQFDYIFRLHYNSKLNYGKNFHPWSYGLSNRILQELQEVPNFSQKQKQLLINFRHWKAGHPVRNLSCKEFIPRIQNILKIDNYIDSPDNLPDDSYHTLQWSRTGGRHYPNYYKRLKNSAACACFGGFFVPSFPSNPGNIINRTGKQILNMLKLKSNTIVQWDSWRFWESLAAGCVTFHLDFEKYGIALPVMPKNWQHYIGIDLDNVQATIDKIAKNPEILEEISTSGRLLVLENYSPVPLAIRFLETISKNKTADNMSREIVEIK
ncbi:glycosyltransferase family 1 protein [Nostoc cycadae]|uniref:Uncharacterized protein n=1 Tax=Nostoc cycadae WK-1 TaxID=1861711 RepID=A0A2H6LIF1_9NOSO|nr:hypothetical protein NCWK1_2751 [Nostoc cycadae WK-1]